MPGLCAQAMNARQVNSVQLTIRWIEVEQRRSVQQARRGLHADAVVHPDV
jgi:hypothetical protein